MAFTNSPATKYGSSSVMSFTSSQTWREFPVTVSVHQTENYSHHHWTNDAAISTVGMSITPSHHSAAHHSHHSAVITGEAALIAVFRFRLSCRTLLSAGSLGSGSLGTRSNNATGEDNRSCREYERMFSHLDLLDEDHSPFNFAREKSILDQTDSMSFT
jgi:hypothetical protein